MSGGQHRDNEVSGPSRSGELETERSRNRESHRPSAAALTHECAQEKQKLRRNVLDGADFVRDVLDIYLEIPYFPITAGGCHEHWRGNKKGVPISWDARGWVRGLPKTGAWLGPLR
jgi:hypothetical protein